MLRMLHNLVVVLLLIFLGITAHAQVSSSYPTATITVGGAETAPGGTWDSGLVTLNFNGFTETVNYGQFSSEASLASGLAALFCRDYLAKGLYAKAGANHNSDLNVITFQLATKTPFGAVDIQASTSSFSFAPSGFGGTSGSTWDQGTATLWFNGTAIGSTPYGEGSNGTSIARDLSINSNSPLVKVTSEGQNLFLQSKQTGTYTDTYSVTFSTSTSFSSAPASGQLSSSTDLSPTTVYSYNSIYDPAGNVQGLSDSVMGMWAYGYDSLNRLTSGVASSSGGPYAGQSACWTYDNFGNRLSQSVSATPCGSSPPATYAATYSANNQIASVSLPANVTVAYDGAGNITNDGFNGYVYDAEGRICAVHGPQGMVGYQYDGDGHRIGKGTISSMSCDLTANGYSPTTDYVLGQGGGQVSEISVGGGTLTWVHTNVSAAGMLIATFDTTGSGLHFHLNDPLGSRRVQTDPAGIPEQTCQSLPFGDQLFCTASLDNPTEHHFTGKERDTESGLDYFGARYYASNMGRWMSPDWSEKVEAVPHAVLTNPQSLNLYQYGLNNPLSNVDPDGHDPQLEYLRRKAVRLAWNDERSMVEKTGTGTRPWTAAERAELLQTGRVSGYVGHHINSVNGSPELAGEPNNIKFVEGVEGNLAEHGGNFGNPTTGELMNRSVVALQAIDMLVNAFGAAYQSNITGIDENFGGSISIADPAKAAVTLDGAFITTYGGFWKTTEGPSYSVRDGQYIDSQTNKAVDPKNLKGKKFYFPPMA